MKWLPLLSILLFGASAWYYLLFCFTWKRRKEPSAFFFSLLLLSVIAWMVPQGLEYLMPSVSLKIWCSKISYIGALTVSVFLFETIYSYIANIQKWDRVLFFSLLMIPTILFFFVLTNGTFHNLLWTSITPIPGTHGQLLDYQHGVVFIITAAYSYLLVLATILMLLYYSLRTDSLFRRRYYALIIGSITPWLGNVLYIGKLLPLKGIDFSVVGFMVSTIVLYFVIYKWHFLDLKPIAYDVLMKSEKRGAIVLDNQERVILANSTVENCFHLPKNIIGKSLPVVFEEYPSFVEAVRSSQNMEIYTLTKPISSPSEFTELSCEIQKTPIFVRDTQVGMLLQIHDITHRIENQRYLELQNKMQEALLSISHTLLSQDQHWNGLIQTMNIVGSTLKADFIRIVRYKPKHTAPWSIFASYTAKNIPTEETNSSSLPDTPLLEQLDASHHSQAFDTLEQCHPYVVPSLTPSTEKYNNETLSILAQKKVTLVPILQKQKGLGSKSPQTSTMYSSLWGYMEIVQAYQTPNFSPDIARTEMQMMEMVASLYTEYMIRKVIQNNLQESKDRFEQVMNQAREIIWETDDQMNLTYLSNSFHKLFSIPDTISNNHWFSKRFFVSRFFQLAHSSDENALETIPLQIEDRFKKQLQKFRDHFKKRKPLQDFLIQILDFKGNTLYLLVNAIPVFDKDHKFRGYRGSGFDVTLMKELEIMKDSFINTVSHEFRTPLFSIRESVNMVHKEALGSL
ncbi:MAG: histidine kinase N-terminal 7TM domain-containing protein, partial [Caldisericia bacterium]|nr:histidine kinase N-terminal 7TM domain-containing protein [Caldisericia bacterium]